MASVVLEVAKNEDQVLQLGKEEIEKMGSRQRYNI
jgi:hypothetical protein